MATIVHIDIPVGDLQRARSFYETIFEWRFHEVPGYSDYLLFETGDAWSS